MLFTYRIYDKDGNEFEGRVEAGNRTAAISLLQSKGYNIAELKEADERSALDINLFERVRAKDILFFARQTSTLLSAGVSALRTFYLVAETAQNKYFKKILRSIARSIEQGTSLEKSFQKYSHIFGEFFVAIIAVGEQSGTIAKSFHYLAEHTERLSDIISKVRKALTYPIIVVVLFVGVIILMLVTIIPQISKILTQSGAELPVATRIVLASSDFLRENVFFILIAIFVGILSLVFYLRTEEGQDWFDTTVLTMPLFGKLVRELNLIRMTSNMSVMLSSGVSLVPTLETVARVMTNKEYRRIVEKLSTDVRVGAPLSQAIEKQPIFGKNIAQVIRIGEESGELSEMLDVITRFYQKQLQTTIDLLLDLIQPTVIVALGVVVGFLIGSVILPIYSISASI